MTGKRGPRLPAAGFVPTPVWGRSSLQEPPGHPQPRRSLGFSSWMWRLQPFVCLKIVTAINVGTWFSTKTDCPGGRQEDSARCAGARARRRVCPRTRRPFPHAHPPAGRPRTRTRRQACPAHVLPGRRPLRLGGQRSSLAALHSGRLPVWAVFALGGPRRQERRPPGSRLGAPGGSLRAAAA